MCSNKEPSWECSVRHKMIIHRSGFPTLDFNDHSILWFCKITKWARGVLESRCSCFSVKPNLFWNLMYYEESIGECKAKRSCKTAFVYIMNLKPIVKLMIQRNWSVFHLEDWGHNFWFTNEKLNFVFFGSWERQSRFKKLYLNMGRVIKL